MTLNGVPNQHHVVFYPKVGKLSSCSYPLVVGPYTVLRRSTHSLRESPHLIFAIAVHDSAIALLRASL